MYSDSSEHIFYPWAKSEVFDTISSLVAEVQNDQKSKLRSNGHFRSYNSDQPYFSSYCKKYYEQKSTKNKFGMLIFLQHWFLDLLKELAVTKGFNVYNLNNLFNLYISTDDFDQKVKCHRVMFFIIQYYTKSSYFGSVINL